MKLNIKWLAALAMLLPVFSFAEITPKPGVYDPRVRIVEYNAQDVVNISTYFGVSTHIKFGDEETIEDKNIGTGDSDAWRIIISGNKNNLFIMPRAKNADMNMTVITNKRIYQFALTVDPRPLDDATVWRSAALIYSLSFRYPDEEAEKAALLAKAEEINRQLGSMKSKLASIKTFCKNSDYWVAGSDEVMPSAACDDGRFIHLTFSNNRDMPAIYTVDSEGKESLVNSNVDGNTIEIHRMVRRLVLRKGNAVACVVNKAFDANGGDDNVSGTISPDVERVIKGVK